MAKKRIRIVNLYIRPGTFAFFFKRIAAQKHEYDFAEIADLRKILSNERAKIVNTLKNKSPNSIYDLAKILGRDFKSVRTDIKLLEKYGIIELKPFVKGKRRSLKPMLILDSLQINMNFE